MHGLPLVRVGRCRPAAWARSYSFVVMHHPRYRRSTTPTRWRWSSLDEGTRLVAQLVGVDPARWRSATVKVEFATFETARRRRHRAAAVPTAGRLKMDFGHDDDSKAFADSARRCSRTTATTRCAHTTRARHLHARPVDAVRGHRPARHRDRRGRGGPGAGHRGRCRGARNTGQALALVPLADHRQLAAAAIARFAPAGGPTGRRRWPRASRWPRFALEGLHAARGWR